MRAQECRLHGGFLVIAVALRTVVSSFLRTEESPAETTERGSDLITLFFSPAI